MISPKTIKPFTFKIKDLHIDVYNKFEGYTIYDSVNVKIGGQFSKYVYNNVYVLVCNRIYRYISLRIYQGNKD